MMFSHGTVSKTKQLIPRHSVPRCGGLSYSIYVSKSSLHPQANVLIVSNICLCCAAYSTILEWSSWAELGMDFWGDKHLRGGSEGSHTEILCLIEPLKTTFYLNKAGTTWLCMCIYMCAVSL